MFSASGVGIQIPRGRSVPSLIGAIFRKPFCNLSNIEALASLPGGSPGCRVVAILFIPGPYQGHVGLSFHSPLRRAFEFQTLGQHIVLDSNPLTGVESAFHSPHTAPLPRAAEAYLSTMVDAWRTRFSPAWPMQATHTPFPWRLTSVSAVVQVVSPHRSSALWKEISPSSISR